MPKTIGEAPDTLPAHAKEIWVAVFNSAWKGTCAKEGERRDECAHRVAWAAVKRDYKQDAGGKWVKRSGAQTDFNSLTPEDLEADYRADFIVAKTSSSQGELRWMGRASDTFEDSLGTRMTKTLFMNFIHRSESFGQPYLGISHYGALDGEGIAGPTTEMWIDGTMFKARGLFDQTSLGLALYGALNTERSAKDLDPDARIRLSLGFLDLKHSHGSFMFDRRSLYDTCPICEMGRLPDAFLDGILLHFAATRVPINQRTSLELESAAAVERSAPGRTARFEDAASIVGEALATKLEALHLANASDPDVELSSNVVELAASQSEVEEAPTPETNLQEEQTMADELNVQLVEDDSTEDGTPETPETEIPETEAPTTPETLVELPGVIPAAIPGAGVPGALPVGAVVSQSLAPVQTAIETFSQSVAEILQLPSLTRQERLEQLQPALELMSAAVVTGAEVASSDPQSQLVGAFRNALRAEMGPLVQGLQQVVMALSAQTTQTPGRRTYSHGLNTNVAPTAPAESKSRIKSLARQSVGLDQDNT